MEDGRVAASICIASILPMMPLFILLVTSLFKKRKALHTKKKEREQTVDTKEESLE